MKRLFGLCLILVMAVSVTACGNRQDESCFTVNNTGSQTENNQTSSFSCARNFSDALFKS